MGFTILGIVFYTLRYQRDVCRYVAIPFFCCRIYLAFGYYPDSSVIRPRVHISDKRDRYSCIWLPPFTFDIWTGDK